MKEIDETFSENIHMCFNGTNKDRNMGYISGTINDGKCVFGVSIFFLLTAPSSELTVEIQCFYLLFFRPLETYTTFAALV